MASESSVRHIFATNLKWYMDKHHMNQNELAARTGASIGAVSNWLNEINEPRSGMLYKLTEIFECNPSDLLEDKTKSPSSKENGPSAEDEGPSAEDEGISPIKRDALDRIMRASDDEARMLMDILVAWQKNKNPAGEGGADD